MLYEIGYEAATFSGHCWIRASTGEAALHRFRLNHLGLDDPWLSEAEALACPVRPDQAPTCWLTGRRESVTV